MPVELLQFGQVYTLIAGTVYALPGCAVHLTSEQGALGDVLEFSNDGVTWDAVLIDAIPFNMTVGATFLRCPDINIDIVIKAR